MKDYKASLEKLRRDAADYMLIRDLATDRAKQEFFAKLADHLNRLADQVEKEICRNEGSSGKSA